MSTATDKLKSKEKSEKPVKPAKFNPFGGKTETVKPALEILLANVGIGIAPYDRGADVWDNDRVNETTKKSEPGWVHVADETLECVISFSVNEGKGTGRQIIPADEFPEYVATLQGIIDSGYEEPPTADRTEYVPTFDVARTSFKLVRPKVSVAQPDGTVKSVTDAEADRDVVSVRCTSGKGAKPMTVAQNEFPGIVAKLAEIADNLSDFEAQAWAGYRAQTPAATPEAETSTDSNE